ncbi:MAG: sulfatase-like hydrolase/transferase [Deltaproteobacteria bacterium]|nr:sulfatase-like hydrolase/transferase [Deltaproteobacteria bacterium]
MLVVAEILVVALVALAVSRLAPEPWRSRLLTVIKAAVTVWAFALLLQHPVVKADGTREVAWRLILVELRSIDAATFWTFVACATAIKIVGILASMLRWTILLRGQGVDLPFRHIFGTFLIGRFLGTFLPGTTGLDGYKLYDAARFSGRTVEVTATTALEKVLGAAGIFLSFLVALPFGIGIFGERARIVALVTVPVCLAIIGGLLLLLWFPGIVQWALDAMPLPGKARLGGVVMRLAHASAAYRDKKRLVLAALGLSFVVHFTTAAMYYFTALAVGAGARAEFWPLVFGSSIQIFATVLAPTMGGVGAREWAQLVTIGHMIGPGKAIVSAALGFWAAEALTLLGGVFWWIRPADYRPAYCRVNGVQVDWEQAAREARSLSSARDVARPAQAGTGALPLPARIRIAAGLGLGTGLVCGLLLGLGDALVVAHGALGAEPHVLWYGPLAYAVVFGALGAAGGGALGVLPMDRDELRGWIPTLGSVALLVPMGLFITIFRVRRDAFAEQPIPLLWMIAILGAGSLLAVALLAFGRRVFTSRAGALVRPIPAIVVTVLVVNCSGIAASMTAPPHPAPTEPRPAPPALANRPNVVLIMVDTLRGDHVGCGAPSPVQTPAMCSLVTEGGTRLFGFSHSSWTKPAAATLLSGLLPSTHGAVTKTASISPDVELLAELLTRQGYDTGAIVSNINLAPSFGFDQGFRDYRYLAPDYLAGATESSSKLILYQIVRKVWFRLRPGYWVSDYYQDAETVTASAFDWLERNRRSRFFFFLHYMDPHDPYFEHPYDGRAIARVADDHPAPSLAPEMRRLYIGEIRYLDEHLEKLFEKLRALGLWDDTLIVLTSDHGEEFDDHGGFWHGTTLYDEQIHVPLLVKWPKGAAPGAPRTDPTLAGLVDVAPTILVQAGAAVPAAMQGQDLAARYTGRAPAVANPVLAETDLEGNVVTALRGMEWKFIEANPDNPRGLPVEQLFDVAKDPGETNDLRTREAALTDRLRAETNAAVDLARQRAVGGGKDATLTEADRERLRALGYIK